ncbi:MAG: prepilin-type N-terminal cleavage/methylation domain-containing protein [Acidobacteria bacterium]|nr:prepilin-type N-terminal cleavage/methylation domain-containing protein [Acidobacteriota bacterium]
MTRCGSRRGVTLMELLIAISMLSLLSAGILMAMRMGLGTMARTKARLMQNRKVQSVARIMEEQVAGLMPVDADCIAGGPERRARIAFFQGEPRTMRFVSSYSLEEAGRGYPRILEYLVIPGEDNAGVRLVVNEHLYSGPLSTGMFCYGMGYDESLGFAAPRFRPVEVSTRSFVLADKLAYCRFIFRETVPAPVLARWTERWVKRGWPSGIRLEMAPLEPDGSRLQLGALTIPVRITKDMDRNYEDN